MRHAGHNPEPLRIASEAVTFHELAAAYPAGLYSPPSGRIRSRHDDPNGSTKRRLQGYEFRRLPCFDVFMPPCPPSSDGITPRRFPITEVTIGTRAMGVRGMTIFGAADGHVRTAATGFLRCVLPHLRARDRILPAPARCPGNPMAGRDSNAERYPAGGPLPRAGARAVPCRRRRGKVILRRARVRRIMGDPTGVRTARADRPV